MPSLTAKELLELVLKEETLDVGELVPRQILGFDKLTEKLDRLADAFEAGMARRDNGEYDYENGEGGHGEEMAAIVQSLEALRELQERPMQMPDDTETKGLLQTIAKHSMRRKTPWEFEIQRDRRTGFIEKIIARPLAD